MPKTSVVTMFEDSPSLTPEPRPRKFSSFAACLNYHYNRGDKWFIWRGQHVVVADAMRHLLHKEYLAEAGREM